MLLYTLKADFDFYWIVIKSGNLNITSISFFLN